MTALPLLAAGIHLPDGQSLQLDTRGLQVYLEMMWAMIEMFLGDVTLDGRIVLASFVCHMLYFGKAAMLQTQMTTDHWMSEQATIDALLACHALVNYLRVIRDRFPHLHDSFDVALAGSDSVEGIFSQYDFGMLAAPSLTPRPSSSCAT
jgi:hypothetical protein